MVQAITFGINSILDFLNMVRNISIPSLGISLLTFFIALKVFDIVITSIQALFGFEKRKLKRSIYKESKNRIQKHKLKRITNASLKATQKKNNNLKIGD